MCFVQIDSETLLVSSSLEPSQFKRIPLGCGLDRLPLSRLPQGLVQLLQAATVMCAGGVAVVSPHRGCASPCAHVGAGTCSPTWTAAILPRHTAPNVLAVCSPCCSPACAQLHSLPHSLWKSFSTSHLFSYLTLICLFSGPEQEINILAPVGSEQIPWKH